MPERVQPATVASITSLCDGVVEVLLDPAQPLAWRPGQYVPLLLGDPAAPLVRPYSIASSPEEGALRLVIKRVPGGDGSARIDQLAPGDRVLLNPPLGFFTLDERHEGDVVFAATGTGIAPVRPMLREVLSRDEAGRVLLFWGLRSEGDLFWRDELAALPSARLTVAVHLTRPGPGWRGGTGRIVAPIVEALPGLRRPTFYMVGNGAMIRELKQRLVAEGVDRKRQVRTEAFFD